MTTQPQTPDLAAQVQQLIANNQKPQALVEPPVIDFARDITMPGKPKDKDGKDLPTMLDDAGRKKAYLLLQDQWHRVAQDAPKYTGDPNDQKALDAFDKVEAAYNNNQMIAIRQKLKEAYNKDLGTQTPEVAEARYKRGLQAEMNKFMNGFDRGISDPTVDAKRQSAFEMLMSGNIPGAIQQFLFSLPLVGDLLEATKKWIGSKFDDDPKNLTFSEARDALKVEKAFKGGAAALGVDANVMLAEGSEAIQNQNFTPATETPKVPAANLAGAMADAAALPKPATQAALDPKFDAPAGTTVPAATTAGAPASSGQTQTPGT